MARLVRADVFDPAEVSVFHCINRCVRRCFLCGSDPVSGRSYEHRKRWLEERLRFLAGCFGIDVLAFAILSNHFHVILRNRPDMVLVRRAGKAPCAGLRDVDPLPERAVVDIAAADDNHDVAFAVECHLSTQ
jgi:hypothetical protein